MIQTVNIVVVILKLFNHADTYFVELDSLNELHVRLLIPNRADDFT